MSELKILHYNFAKIYRFNGVTFEWHEYLGPIIINRHTEQERYYKNISLRNWSAVNKFSSLNDNQKEKYRIF